MSSLAERCGRVSCREKNSGHGETEETLERLSGLGRRRELAHGGDFFANFEIAGGLEG